MKRWKDFAVLATVCVYGPLVSAADAGGSLDRGKNLYMKNMCYSCHGTVGQGGERAAGPKIAPNAFPLEAFATLVRRPRGNMPHYSEKFVSDQDMADIYAYVSSIPPGPAAKDIPLLK